MSAKGCQKAMAVNLARRGPRRPPRAPRRARSPSSASARSRGSSLDAVERHGHARALERARVGLALVAQHVVAGGEDVGGREASRGRPRSGEASGSTVGAVEVEVPEALHRGRGQAVALAELAVGRRVEARVDHRVDQQLEPQPLLELAGDDRGQVAARAVAGDASASTARSRRGRPRAPPETGARARAGSRC